MLTPAGIFSLGDIYCLSLRWRKKRSFYHRKFTSWMLTLRKKSTVQNQPKIPYSYGHLLVITGYKWDYTFYKWGYKYL